ncbi:DUF1259 domain-containing protein [Alicyclobacillus dauci]|uniref:DUF1259 domain-containing protein n=1 Tax=Alicyclobacillus dauci TaxID=1475485 RepID=A0ABY6YZY8_9BACL|nr:DUF1259 domain-containing protein [Alicyclobacillus dauci]WAH36184.1 DUF1259 domain-containing protein [Alicyclobacillus dauci]
MLPIKLANEFAKIVGGKVIANSKSTEVTVERELNATILGRSYDTEHEIAIGSLDRHGRALETGEFTVLQTEVNRFISALRRQGLRVTAVHNHWLFEKPRLMYVHTEAVERPLVFARKVARAFTVLNK